MRCIVPAVLKITGSEFQEKGAATAKALDPHFVRKRGTANIFVLEDLSNLEFWRGTKYLKKICRLVKKQGFKSDGIDTEFKTYAVFYWYPIKKFKRGLKLLKRDALQTTRARQFCTRCNLSMFLSGRWYKRELQLSIWLVTRAHATYFAASGLRCFLIRRKSRIW